MNGMVISQTALFGCWVAFIWPHWHGDLSHGPIAAGLAAWLLWQRRGDWKPLPLVLHAVFISVACFLVAAGVTYRASVGPTAGAAVLVSLGLMLVVLGACGTKAIFPGVFLMLTAVPAPGSVWLPMVTGLQRTVAMIDAEVLRLFGAPVVLEGALLRIGDTVVSVDAACSGVRGIQMGVMVALFLGVIFLGTSWRRWVLLVVTLVLVFLGNLGRSLVLSFAGWRGGAQAIETFHDPVGWAAFAFSLASIGVTCWLMRSPLPPAEITRRRMAVAWPTWLPMLSLAVLVAGGFGHFLVTSAPIARGVIFEMQSEVPGWRFEPQRLPNAAIEMLHMPEIVNGVFIREADGLRVRVFFARWPNGAPQDVFGHTPDLCWPNSGWQPRDPSGAADLEILGIRVPFNRRVFVAPDGAQEETLWVAFRGGRVITDKSHFRIWESAWWARLRERHGDGEDSFLRISSKEIHGDYAGLLNQLLSPRPN